MKIILTNFSGGSLFDYFQSQAVENIGSIPLNTLKGGTYNLLTKINKSAGQPPVTDQDTKRKPTHREIGLKGGRSLSQEELDLILP